jgi:murein DD-endopeptidase MepM/ murein hydrolase activator NlpD
MQDETIPNDFAVFPCSPDKRCTVAQGDLLGLAGNSGNSDGPHLHFVLMDGSNADVDEGRPVFFNNIQFDGMLQTSVSLHTGTTVEDVLPAPSKIVSNPPSPSGVVVEIEPNDTIGRIMQSVADHHSGSISRREAPMLAVRGDPIEDVFRVNWMFAPAHVALSASPADVNLTPTLWTRDFLMNPAEAGWPTDQRNSGHFGARQLLRLVTASRCDSPLACRRIIST